MAVTTDFLEQKIQIRYNHGIHYFPKQTERR